MARNKRKRSRRVVSINANGRLPVIDVSRLSVRPVDLRLFEDRRAWHPDRPNRPVMSFNRSRHRLVARDPLTRRRGRIWRSYRGVNARIGFADPDRVLVCVRRRKRREVLFAKRKTGRGVKKRHPRFTELSKISCRR